MFSRRNADRKRGANGKTLKELQKQFGMLAKDGAGQTEPGRRTGLGAIQGHLPGIAASITSVAYGLSFAALIFAPPLNPMARLRACHDLRRELDRRYIRRSARFSSLRHCRA
jgi:hypothetical protein